MLETGSPPEHEEQKPRSVSPLSSLHASRSSTPGISSLDGTPRYLFAFTPSPPRPRSTSVPDMAIKPFHYGDISPEEQRTKVKLVPPHGSGAQVAPEESTHEPLSPQDASEEASLNGQPDVIPSLSELSRLLRLENYQSRRSRQVQHQLYHVHTVAAQTARLIHTARSVQRTLAECIKLEDKHSFVNLFNAFHDALSDCSEATKSLGEYDWTEKANCVEYPASFVDVLPLDSRNAILEFLPRIRHDGNFVADRLTALTSRELVSLLPEKGQSKSTDSVFGSSPRTSSRSSRHLGFVADGQTELLSSSEYACPLETLIFSVRGISDCSLHEDDVATDLWATVCARLISEQKPGSEKLVPAVIDMWALSSPWPGRERLSVWISQTLQKGSFILEQHSKQSFRLRVQSREETGADDDIRLEQFYTTATDSLLCLLQDRNGASLIPEGARKLCHAIYQRLQRHNNNQHAFPNFVLTRWLFSSFLPDAITLPEIHGLLTDHFISDHARQRILREVASRCQKIAFDVVYAWKHANTVSLETTRAVRSIAERFQPLQPGLEEHMKRDFRCTSKVLSNGAFLPMSASDINTLVNALYPQRRPISFSDRDPSQAGLQSSASSLSGFSLFQTSGQMEPGHRAASPGTLDTAPFAYLEGITRPDRKPFPESGGAELHPDWDAERLREACAGIEDYVASETSSGTGHWSILVADMATQRFVTVRDALSKHSDSTLSNRDAPLKVASGGFNHQSCRNAVEELLFNDNTVSQYFPTSDSSTQRQSDVITYLLDAFEARINSFEEVSDFVAAHSWFRKLGSFRALVAEENDSHSLMYLLKDIERRRQRSLDQALRLTDSCDAWLRSTRPFFEGCNKDLLGRKETARHLRDKMWYVADVRTSAPYDEVRSVASVLKVMGKPRIPARTRLAPPLRHWSASKISSTSLHLKSEAQVLEILSAAVDYGGPNKLSDDQSQALSTWMGRNAVENLCRGEERLHKLCMEIRKAVDQLTAESSTLLSSTLLARDNGSGAQLPKAGFSNPFWSPQGARRFDLLTLQTNVPPSDTMSSTSSHPLSARSSRDYLESRSPALTAKSSAPFWSPAMTEARSPSSATSMGSSQTHAPGVPPARQQNIAAKASSQSTMEQLRQRTTSLLLSDLANALFGDGSETDRAFWTGLGKDLSEKHLRSLVLGVTAETSEASVSEAFDFERAFEKIFHRFSASCNPFAKLAYLFDIDTLLGPYITQQAHTLPQSRPELQLRTLSPQQLNRQNPLPIVDFKVDGFRRLFCNPLLRPSAIFRDLQYIAALVPSTTLESTPQGKAFWNATVAVLGLKQEVRQVMVETADGIIAYQSNNRGHGRAASAAQQERDSATFSAPSRTPSAEDISHYDMADAAYLLQITAKEGDAAAQRELATLYLTNPELMDHIIAPLSRPRDVFREELESKWRKNRDPNRCDPTTMCVAHHWMSLSSKGGDALAKEYLRQREEMDRLG